MEIKGNEFLKNVQNIQEEENLRQKINQFDTQREQNFANNSMEDFDISSRDPRLDKAEALYNLNLGLESMPNQNDNINEVDEFIHQQSLEQKGENKKKYLLLGVALVLLFVISIIMIRLISSDDSNLQEETEQITQESVLNEQIQQDYQQIKDDGPQNQQANAEDEAFKMPPQYETTQEIPTKITQQVEPQEKPQIKTTPKVVKPAPTPAPTPAPAPKQTTKAASTTPASKPLVYKAPKGHYVQIGSFLTKTLNQDFLKKVTDNGYTYKLNSSANYSQVLVGPFNTRVEATSNLKRIREITNQKEAFTKEIK